MKALVISITGDNVESDVIAAKAAALFAEETQLASARLYFTLRDALEASSRHGGGLSREFGDLAERIGLAEGVRPRAVVSDDPRLSTRSLLALRELREGWLQKAFEVTPYAEVVETAVVMMRGHVPMHDTMPVLDRKTMNCLDGFFSLTLEPTEPGALGPLRGLNRISARPGLIANSFLGRIKAFPDKPWEDLLRMREDFKECREKFLSTIAEIATEIDQQLGRSVNDGDALAHVDEFAAFIWAKMNSQAKQLDQEVDALAKRWPSRIVGAGLPKPVLAMGIATASVAAGVAAHHPVVAEAGLSAGMYPALDFCQALVQLAGNRRGEKGGIRASPYWFVRKTALEIGQPSWQEGLPRKHASERSAPVAGNLSAGARV